MSRDEALKAAHDLAAVLGVILKMSDDVKDAGSPLDMQGKLLRLHNSIQKNGPRLASLVAPVLLAMPALSKAEPEGR